MSMSFIRNTYHVPAKRGGRIEYTGDARGAQRGTILSASHQLRVRLDDKRIVYLHPTWRVRYLDGNSCTKEGQEP